MLVFLPRVKARCSINLPATDSAVAAYEFTTLTVVPGALEHKGAKIQLLDIPGLIAGAAMGKGRGKEVIGVVRGADIIIILVDVFNERHFDVLLKELYDAGIRINVPKPDITIKKSSHGGIRLHAVGTLNLDIEEVRSILAESKMMNADVLVRGGATQDDLIDAIQGNRVYVPAFIAVNKVDLVDKERYLEIEHDIAERFGAPPLMISASAGYHLEEVKDAIYDCLGFIRVYLKPHGGEADLEEPLIIRTGSTVADVCTKTSSRLRPAFPLRKGLGQISETPRSESGITPQTDRQRSAYDYCRALIASKSTSRGASVLIPYPEKCVRVAGYPEAIIRFITRPISGGEHPTIFVSR